MKSLVVRPISVYHCPDASVKRTSRVRDACIAAPGAGFSENSFMLKETDLDAIEHDFGVRRKDVREIRKISGGDVNETYLIENGDSRFFIKKIAIDELSRLQNASTRLIEKSIEFHENIVAQLAAALPAVAALPTKAGKRLLKDGTHGLLIYPFVDGLEKADEEITETMVRMIAGHLLRLHGAAISFDHGFAQEKFRAYQDMGIAVLNSSAWKRMAAIPFVKYLMPNFHWVFQYVNKIRNELRLSIGEITGDAICHNDLKPKNVLWTESGSCWIIDWDAAGLFDAASDHLDTALSWSTHHCDGTVFLKPEKFKAFIETYPFPDERKLGISLNIVVIKWCYWLIFCIRRLALFQGSPRRNMWNIRYALGFIRLLGRTDFEKHLIELSRQGRA